ncbi:MAG: HTTM domain-containing protein [Pirellulaceae bacterium]
MSRRRPDNAPPEPQLDGSAGWLRSWAIAWDRFWFTPARPHTLALMRILCGAMLTYVHVIWASQLTDFMGPHAWLDSETVRSLHQRDWGWSWLFYTDSRLILGLHQTVAIVAGLMMTAGVLTRIALPLSWWMTLMVCHRMTGALFGLDQIVVMLSMYLMWSHCGSVWSFDAWWAKRVRREGAQDNQRSSWWFPSDRASVSNNIATRLIQLHLCVIYLFGGLSKMRGEMWWDGSALWYTAVNYEYQSLDITWLGHFRILIAALTAATIFWETFYVALVWPKLTRPIALAMAVLVHGGIAVALGMITFGTIMIVANIAFISPASVARLAALCEKRGV